MADNTLLRTTFIPLIFGNSLFYLTIIRPFQHYRRFVFFFRETACFHNAITQYERIRYSGIQCHVTRRFVPEVSTQRAGLIFKGMKSNVHFFNEHSTNFDVHRAVLRNIISIVKPTRCTNVSNLFYFGMTLYMFRTVFPSIISSSKLYIQQQAFVKQILLSAC